MRNKNYLVPALMFSVLAWGCSKDKNTTTTPITTIDTTTTYTVPTTYNFTNVSYSNQQKLLLMADQIGVAVNLGNASGVTVSAQLLKDMFNNVGGHFVDSSLVLNTSGLKLSAFCSAAAAADMSNYFDSVGLYSQSAVAGSKGVAGVSASSVSATKKYLLSPNGTFYSQIIKKTLQHGVFGYAIANMFMKDSVANGIDNSTVVTGSGTALEHKWDEAFGFFGVPVDFPTNVKGIKYLASYSNQVDAGLQSNSILMNAFIKGRAAISGKDMTTKAAQASIIVVMLEKLNAAAIVQEMKETDANIDAGDAVAAYGTLSESIGFLRTLKYNTSSQKIITSAQIAELEALYDSVTPSAPNLYKFMDAGGASTVAQLKAKTDAIRQKVGVIYGFTAAQLAAQ